MRTERFHSPTDSVPDLAVFIFPTGDGTHVGILHRMKGMLVMQEMAWHERFSSEPCRRVPPFVEFALEPEVVDRVRGICRLIHDRHHSGVEGQRYRIPYAFRHGNNNRFNSANGELMLVDGFGLTCATFVLTVFQSAEVMLVEYDGWQLRPDDNARFLNLLDKMRNGIPEANVPAASPEHVRRVESELPCIRVRPEEVAATGLFDDLPANFAQLAPAGEWILQQLPPRQK